MMVIKRNGELEDFDFNKVINAASRAFAEYDMDLPPDVFLALKDKFRTMKKLQISVEEIQNIIEEILGQLEYHKVLRSFIEYRDQKHTEREMKKKLLKRNWLTPLEKKQFSVNAIYLLAQRYLWKDEEGNFVETIDDMFARVAITGALPEITPFANKPPLSYYADYEYSNSNEFEEVWQDLVASHVVDNNEYRAFTLEIEGIKFPFTKYHVERLYSLIKRWYNSKYDHKLLLREKLYAIQKHQETTFEHWAYMFYKYMTQQMIMPNTPALVNAGRPLGMLSACFVVKANDSVDSIFDTAKDIAMITKAGGGIGLDFSVFRPKGDLVRGTMGVASGAMSWLHLYNSVLDVLKQGSTRRGAGMAVLWYWHPEIFDFINAKKDNDGYSILPNFNLSIGTDEKFWQAVKDDDVIQLINPRNNEIVDEVAARDMLYYAAQIAWKSADPAVLNFSFTNKYFPSSRISKITATNPCGEEHLLPYQSCNLVSVNVAQFVKDGKFDFDAFSGAVQVAYRWADNVNDVNYFPLPEIAKITRSGRNVGVGLMGIADALFALGLSYEEEDGLQFMEQVARELTLTTIEQSVEMARYKYPMEWSKYYQDVVEEIGTIPVVATIYETVEPKVKKRIDLLVSKILAYGIRNIDHTTVPPTGSVSMIADTTNGIEPIFGLTYTKKVTVGTFRYTDQVFWEYIKKHINNVQDLDFVMNMIEENQGSLKGLDEELARFFDMEDVQYMTRVFRTALDLHHWSHLLGMQAIAKWITNAVSKTINMSSKVTVDDVYEAFILSDILKLKGVTVYRDKALPSQVLNSGNDDSVVEPYPPSEHVRAIITKKMVESGYEWLAKKHIEAPKRKIFTTFAVNDEEAVVDVCPVCGTPLRREAGCTVCPNCGWSGCSVS